MNFLAKTISVLALTGAFSTLASAQTLPDLKLSNAMWQWHVSYIGAKKTNADKAGRFQEDYPPDSPDIQPTQYDRGLGDSYTASVRAQNSGAKTITAVTWEYIFYKNGQQLTPSFKFSNKIKIKPGQTVTLKSSYPLGQPKSQHSAARVLRIEYSDGTFWERS